MARRTTVAIAAACCLALTLLPASAALAGAAFNEVLKDYQKDGQLDPCAHSEPTLRDAQKQIPKDVQQYAPDLPAAIAAGRRSRAAGACNKKGGAAPVTGTTAKPGAAPPAGGAPASKSSSASSGGTSAWVILLVILGAIILAVAIFALVARFMGWDFRRLAPARHAWREAGWRTENTVSEFVDWIRLGR